MSPYLFKTAVKNVVSKTNTSIFSLVGLTIAFISIFYIFSYVSFELGYDSQHENADRIYRISGEIVASEASSIFADKRYLLKLTVFTLIKPLNKSMDELNP